jgi:peptide deformylase
MSILKVARMGHPVLRQKARPIEPRELKTVALQKLIDDMVETMHEYGGVGLAGPQVHESLRLFVASLDSDGKGDGDIIAIVNPEITVVGADIVEGWEGCLSIPDIRGRVPRAQRIKLSALSRDGKRLEIDAHDFPARVIQHETDHLDGILFFDRMRHFETLTYMEEFSRYHSGRGDDEDDDDES